MAATTSTNTTTRRIQPITATAVMADTADPTLLTVSVSVSVAMPEYSSETFQ